MRKPFWIICLIIILSVLFVSCGTNPTIPTMTPLAETPTKSASALPTDTATPTVVPIDTATPAPTPLVVETPSPTPDANVNRDQAKVKVKAIYLSGPVVSARFDHYIELLNQTELNALVIDIKEGGIVNYRSNVPLVKELGLDMNYYKPEEILKKCHDNNIYVIGRIVVFRDNGLATKKKEYAIKKPGGSLWVEGDHGSWTDPFSQGVQSYNIDIAKEAVELGFDEIQFDYVRFPTAKASNVAYDSSMPEKGQVIAQFLKRASEEIKQVRKVPVSADVFGIIGESAPDGKAIGQELELVGLDIDYISPMIYPSHYANSSNGTFGNGVGQKINGVLFTHPDLYPYDVVYNALVKIKSKIEAMDTYRADVRPYLQDFTITMVKGYYQEYGAEQVKQQIQAVYDAGYEEWILWDGRNTYSEDAFTEGQ